MSLANFTEGHPLTSPRSLLSCKRLGIEQSELQSLPQNEISQRFKHLPPGFRKEAEQALEEDRQQILIELTKEYNNILLNGITLAEKVAFPDLQGFCKIQSERQDYSEQKAQIEDKRHVQYTNEFKYIQKSLETLEARDQNFSLSSSQIRAQQQIQREANAQALQEKTKNALHRSTSFQQQKVNKFIGKLQTQQYLQKPPSHDNFQFSRQKSLQQWSETVSQQQLLMQKSLDESELRKLQTRQEYDQQLKEIEQKRNENRKEILEIRKQNQQEIDKRVRSVQVQRKIILEKRAADLTQRFDKLEQFQTQTHQNLTNSQLQKQTNFSVQRTLRMRQINQKLSEIQQQKENKFKLVQAQQQVREGQILQNRQNFIQERSSQNDIQNELRKRRMARIEQKKDFSNFVKLKNDEFEFQQRKERALVATQQREKMMRLSQFQEQKNAQKLNEMLDKKANLNQFVKRVKSQPKQKVKVCEQKVLVSNYLADPEIIKKGFIEIKKGWKDWM